MLFFFPASECSAYTPLNEADRKLSFLDKLVVKCDNHLTGKWYRFTGEAPGSIPESCVEKYRCGTHAPGWLKGKHPTVAEGVVTRQVCYNWGDNCCHWSNDIQIRNCGEFYVYNLPKAPACQLRYCSGGPPPIGKSSVQPVRDDSSTVSISP